MSVSAISLNSQSPTKNFLAQRVALPAYRGLQYTISKIRQFIMAIFMAIGNFCHQLAAHFHRNPAPLNRRVFPETQPTPVKVEPQTTFSSTYLEPTKTKRLLTPAQDAVNSPKIARPVTPPAQDEVNPPAQAVTPSDELVLAPYTPPQTRLFEGLRNYIPTISGMTNRVSSIARGALELLPSPNTIYRWTREVLTSSKTAEALATTIRLKQLSSELAKLQDTPNNVSFTCELLRLMIKVATDKSLNKLLKNFKPDGADELIDFLQELNEAGLDSILCAVPLWHEELVKEGIRSHSLADSLIQAFTLWRLTSYLPDGPLAKTHKYVSSLTSSSDLFLFSKAIEPIARLGSMIHPQKINAFTLPIFGLSILKSSLDTATWLSPESVQEQARWVQEHYTSLHKFVLQHESQLKIPQRERLTRISESLERGFISFKQKTLGGTEVLSLFCEMTNPLLSEMGDFLNASEVADAISEDGKPTAVLSQTLIEGAKHTVALNAGHIVAKKLTKVAAPFTARTVLKVCLSALGLGLGLVIQKPHTLQVAQHWVNGPTAMTLSCLSDFTPISWANPDDPRTCQEPRAPFAWMMNGTTVVDIGFKAVHFGCENLLGEESLLCDSIEGAGNWLTRTPAMTLSCASDIAQEALFYAGNSQRPKSRCRKVKSSVNWLPTTSTLLILVGLSQVGIQTYNTYSNIAQAANSAEPIFANCSSYETAKAKTKKIIKGCVASMSHFAKQTQHARMKPGKWNHQRR